MNVCNRSSSSWLNSKRLQALKVMFLLKEPLSSLPSSVMTTTSVASPRVRRERSRKQFLRRNFGNKYSHKSAVAKEETKERKGEQNSGWKRIITANYIVYCVCAPFAIALSSRQLSSSRCARSPFVICSLTLILSRSLSLSLPMSHIMNLPNDDDDDVFDTHSLNGTRNFNNERTSKPASRRKN